MKNEKIIVITLKVEVNDEKNITDEFIKHDLKQEISYCSNYYEIIDFTIKENKAGAETRS